jgi:hypothetical protein
MSRIKDSVATQPPAPGPFGALRTGYAAGRQLATEDSAAGNWVGQAQQTHWGYAGNDPAAHGTIANADSGSELATSEDIAGLHSRFDQLQGQVGGMASSGQGGGGQQGNQNMQQLTPSRMPERPASVSPLAASATQRQNAMDRMAASHEQLANTRANTVAHFQQRQAAGAGGIAPPHTTNAMSDAHAEASFNGMFGSGVGSAPSTWNVAKWQSR